VIRSIWNYFTKVSRGCPQHNWYYCKLHEIYEDGKPMPFDLIHEYRCRNCSKVKLSYDGSLFSYL